MIIAAAHKFGQINSRLNLVIILEIGLYRRQTATPKTKKFAKLESCQACRPPAPSFGIFLRNPKRNGKFNS